MPILIFPLPSGGPSGKTTRAKIEGRLVVASAQDLSLDVEHLGRRHVVPEGLEVVERPDHFLAARHLEQLRAVRPGVAVADHDVAAGQHPQRRHPGQADTGQFVLADAPDDLALRADLQHAVVVAAGDQGVAAGQAQGAEDLDAVPLRVPKTPEATVREGGKALEAAQKAHALASGRAEMAALAAAHAELGQFDKAVEWQEKATASNNLAPPVALAHRRALQHRRRSGALVLFSSSTVASVFRGPSLA